MASDTTTKNQVPDMDIMVFQIRPGAANGTSRVQNWRQDPSRRERETSARSRGTVFSDW
jgi:hypothetical protein